MSTDEDNKDELVIPITTVARIFKEISFHKDNTRITQNALQLSTEYIKLFIREAILRSNEERIAERDNQQGIDGIDNVNNKVIDETFDESNEVDDDGELLEPRTQTNTAFNSNVEIGTDTLDSRHLETIAGVLLLDF